MNALRAQGYRPSEYIEQNPALKEVLALLESDFFSLGDPRRYHGIVHALRTYDTYMVCADFADYVAKEAESAALFRNPRAWSKSSLYNIAGSGRFSSDATIRAYAEEIWQVSPVKVDLGLVSRGHH